MNFSSVNCEVFNSEPAANTALQSFGYGSMGFRFRFIAKIGVALEPDREQQNIGRIQVGRPISLSLQVTNKSSFAPTGPTKPDSYPIARIYSTNSITRTQKIPIDTSSGATGIFRGNFNPGNLDSAGRYYVLFEYPVGGSQKAQLSSFELMPGGHPNGGIMSTFSFAQPSGGTLVAHHESGLVSLGLRPYLDKGD